MIFVLITTFVFLAVILGAAFIFIWNYSKKRRQSGKKPIHMAIPAVMLAAGVIGMALVPGSFHTVNAGEVAVVKRMGVITNVEQPGTNGRRIHRRRAVHADIHGRSIPNPAG